MNTEQRLRFEAKHKVPDGVVWIDEVGYLPNLDVDLPDHFKSRMANRQNDLWQGYQSALEDRQGEAVATLRIEQHDERFGYDINLDCIDVSYDDFVALCQKLGPGEHKLFTSPQPAQPEQWKPLSDVQWMNIVNHDHAWLQYTKDEAVHEAVKMTEAKCKENNAMSQSQPDQWNAAIEAAAEVPRKKKLSAEILMQHDGNTKDDLVNLKAEAWTLGVVETDILALRKDK